MQNSQGAMFFGLGIDMTEWRKNIEEIRRDITGLSNSTQRETQKMDNSFRNLSLGIGAYFSATALQGFAMQLINVRGEFQKTEIAFSTMLKSKEKAKVLMGEMVDLAAKTPFGLQEVTEGAKRLLAFQIPAEQVTETLRRMGDVAAGLGVPMGQLIHVYGQVKAQGKLMTNDLYQFMNAGIPILAELGKVMGKAEEEVKKMVGEGKVGFAEVQQVIQNMTNEGGIFFNLMEAQSSSLSGKVANLQDAFEQMLNKIGESNEGLLADGIEGLTYLVENYEEVIKVLTILVTTYGAYRAALIATSVAQQANIAINAVSTWLSLAKSIRTAKDAQALLNLTMSANPLGAVLAVLGLVITSYVTYGEEIKRFIGLTQKANEEMKVQEQIDQKLTDTFSKGIAEKRAQIQGLIAVINNENSTLDQRKSAYERLIAIDPSFRGTLDSQYKATYRLTDAFDAVIKKMQEFALAQAKMAAVKDILEKNAQAQMKYALAKTKYDDAVRREKELKNDPNAFNTLRKEFGDPHKLSSAVVEAQKEAAEATKQANVALKIQSQELDYHQKKYTEIQKLEKNGWKMANGKKYAEKHIEEFKQKRSQSESILTVAGVLSTPASSSPSTPSDGKKNDKNKNTKGNQRELAEVYSKDSIADLEERISLWNNALKRASKGEDGKLIVKERTKDKYGKEKETGNIVSGEYALEQLRILEEKKRALEKELETKTFQEKINEAERHWNNYYKMAEYYGKESANAQYSELFKGNQSYLDFLEKEAEALANKPGILSDEDKENLIFLQDKIQNLSGAKTPLENWKSELADSLRGVTLLSEQIDIIDNKVAEIYAKEGNSSNFLQFNKEAEAQKNSLINQVKDQYQAFLDEHKTYEEKATALTEHYAQLRAMANTDAERKKIDKAEAEDKSKLELDFFKESGDWELAFSNLDYLAQSTIQRLIKNLEEFKKAKADTLQPTELKELNNAIEQLRSRANRNPLKGLIDGLIGTINGKKRVKKAQDEYNEALNQFGANSEQARQKQKQLTEEELESAKAKQKLIEGINDTQEVFNALGEGVMGIVDSLGGLDDASKDAIEDIMAIGNAALDLGAAMVSGKPSEMIKAGIKLVGNLFKALSGDKKKERNIKNWALALDKVKEKYRELEHQIKRTLGENQYKEQANIIANLRQQQKYLQNMAREEASKKKSDKGKIEQYNNEFQDINRQIDDIFNNIKTQLVGTDAKSLADEIGDALVDAFTKGEDAAEAYEKKMNDVMRNVVKNALKQKLLQEPMQAIIDDMIVKMGFGGAGDENVRRQIEEVEGKIKQMNDKIKNGNIFDKIYTGLSKIGLQNKLEELKKQYEDSKKLNLQGTFDGLTDEERAEIKKKGVDAMERYTKALEEYELLFGASADNADSLKGAIKGMSEETAGVLAGQFNAIRINTADALRVWKEFQNKNFGLDIARDSLMALVNIERHTSNLEAIKKDISELNAKVKGDGGIRAGGF